jgi:hypothetical protein
MAHAVEDGLIPANPAAGIRIPQTRARKIVPPGRADVEKLIEHARPDARPVFVVAAVCGLRRGERFVPLFQSARTALAEAKLRSRFARPEDFLFATAIGTPLDPGNFVRREFKSALAPGSRHSAFTTCATSPCRRSSPRGRHQALAGNRRACLGDDDARHVRPSDDGAGAGSSDAL